MTKILQKISPILFSFLLFSVGFSGQAYAQAPYDYSSDYGLELNYNNAEESVSKIKALEVLLNYFEQSEITESPVLTLELSEYENTSNEYQVIYRACQLGLFNCDLATRSTEPVLGQEVLSWYFQLKSASDYRFSHYKNLATDYIQGWLEAKRLNLLSSENITYQALNDLIYRDVVVDYHFRQPYLDGMLPTYENITPENYHDLKEIDYIQSKLKAIRNQFKTVNPPSYSERQMMSRVNLALQKFSELEDSLERYPYILRQRPDLDPAIKQQIFTYGLQEVLYSYSYYYGENADYRQHNVLTGTTKFHGKVYQPDDILDYWTEISDNNLSDFKYGWVIAGGIEQWQFGGGICGSSTMVFLPSWKAGLDIVERRNHSKYYGDLYPIDDIGLDATVYHPSPNLRIRNNHDQPIVYNVIDDKEAQTVTLEIIGNPIHKSVEIEGPIYVSAKNIQWKRHFIEYDGSVETETLNNYYNKIYRPY